WAAIPGWSLSLIVHAVFLFILSTQLKSCGGTIDGSAEGTFRSVGLVVKENQAANFSENQAEAEARQPVDPVSELPEVPDKPPVEPLLPDFSSSATLGPGAEITLPSGFSDPGDAVVQPAVGSIPFQPALGAGPGDVHFLGAVDQGKTIVYIIDCSGSMGDYDALEFAKAELMASLQGLNAAQKFHVIFYNEQLKELDINQKPGELATATDVNRNLTKRFIGTVRPQMGTRHVPALTRALVLKPDVIFFLTDAQQPKLEPAELDDIKKMNRGGARIHCIEFGKGKELNLDNFLKKLARQNGGTHGYRDVSKLKQKEQ
ncbi:MAG TPA: hypothetical protein VMM56_07620, partial [Planctomycetaceae bacterium]|nr:hypothetical protein [Planctomycetaceae bacterium]